MGWNIFKKNKQQDEIKIEVETFLNKLSIKFINKDTFSLECEQKNNVDTITPWKDFYIWYFSRPQSDKYVLHFKDGLIMIKRNDIQSFKIEIIKNNWINI